MIQNDPVTSIYVFYLGNFRVEISQILQTLIKFVSTTYVPGSNIQVMSFHNLASFRSDREKAQQKLPTNHSQKNVKSAYQKNIYKCKKMYAGVYFLNFNLIIIMKLFYHFATRLLSISQGLHDIEFKEHFVKKIYYFHQGA